MFSLEANLPYEKNQTRIKKIVQNNTPGPNLIRINIQNDVVARFQFSFTFAFENELASYELELRAISDRATKTPSDEVFILFETG